LSPAVLGHLELNGRDFVNGLSHDAFRTTWANFLHADDTLVVYHQSTLGLLAHVQGNIGKCLVLKSVSLDSRGAGGTLEERLAAEGLVSEPAELPGRAGRRLAKAITLVRHLNVLGNANLALGAITKCKC
jgi:hypothetical protein